MTKQNKAYKFRIVSNRRTSSVLSEKPLVVFVLSTTKCWQNGKKRTKHFKDDKEALERTKVSDSC